MEIIWFQPSRGARIATVSEQGISFNKAAAEALGMPEFVRLGFVPGEKCIAVQPVDREEDAFPFASRFRAGAVKVNSRDFIRELRSYVKVDLSSSRRYLARWDADRGVLLIDLNEPVDEKDEGRRGQGKEDSGSRGKK